VDLELRPIVTDDLPAFKRADEYGFGFRHQEAETDPSWAEAELDRTVAAFDGGEIVATGRNYSLDLTLPGGAVIPTAAVSWISVRPSHRRRGIMRRTLTSLIEEGARRGEAVSILTASEGGIYGRFGFGVANRVLSVTLERSEVAFVDPVTAGRVRMVEPEEMLKLAPELFDRVRSQRNGAVSRPPVWWTGAWVPHEVAKHRFDVVYELEGRVEAFAVYDVDGPWRDGFPDRTVTVLDLVAATPDAEAALWQFVCGIDLIRRVTAPAVPTDLDLPWRLVDSRQVRTTSLRDWLWLRPIDVPALLGARRYATADRLVLDVHDEMRPGGDAAGRFLVEGGPDGATCVRTDASADVALTVAALGAISLGGTRASTLARAGRVDERVSGALAVADRMFAADRAPFSFTWF
jgi:predicted acetyltransferase